MNRHELSICTMVTLSVGRGGGSTVRHKNELLGAFRPLDEKDGHGCTVFVAFYLSSYGLVQGPIIYGSVYSFFFSSPPFYKRI